MNIKYLKDAPQGTEGEVVELDEVYANALIAMGFAEAIKEDKPKAKPTAKKTKTTDKNDDE